jgi:hypothetical protein
MSINNREDANSYYDEMKKLVNDYIGKESIRPSELRRYMKTGNDNFNLFLKMNNLQEVNGIDVVLKDTIDDLVGMEEDGVMTFEKFKLYESDEYKISEIGKCLSKGINRATVDTEKAIAEYYDTNLGHIESIDPEEHSFSVEGWGNEETLRVIAYSQSEIEIIYENVSEYLFNEAKSKSINLPVGIEISLNEILDENTFKEKLKYEMLRGGNYSERGFISIIENLTETDFKGKKMEYYIFEGSF